MTPLRRVVLLLLACLTTAVKGTRMMTLMQSRASQRQAVISASLALMIGATSLPFEVYAADGPVASIMASREALGKLKMSSDLVDFETASRQMLETGKLKENVLKALDTSLSVDKNGKDYYNTVRFHGTEAVQDLLQIREWFDSEETRDKRPSDVSEKDVKRRLEFARRATEAAERELALFLDGLVPPTDKKK